ncbi:MAG: DUF4037 domain-containing protein, partial [Patescibacteria group bacterium]
MFNKFYLKQPKQIANEVRKYFKDDFFKRHPKLENKISIIIVGSIATANYDKHSDIDLDILFTDKNDFDNLLTVIKQYKRELRKKKIPIQIHTPRTYKEIENQLKSWEKDGMLKEYSQAIIISDPKNKFTTIQKKYQWYPKNIFNEKLSWLFAELMFEYKDRYLIAVKRKDLYFGEVVKIKLLKYMLTILLVVNKKYPAFDKHLYQDIKKIRTLPKGFLKTANKLLIS